MHVAVVFIGAGGHLVDGTHGQPVKPRFECEELGLIAAVSEGIGNGFMDDVILADGVAQNLLGSFPEIELAFDKTLQPGEVDIDVGADVVARNQRSLHGRDGVFERDLLSGTRLPSPAPTWELVSGPEKVLVAGGLVGGMVKNMLDWGGGRKRL